uniref:Uncharacterized protein n=1 Tax=Lepeophtheirus salmonis TaxID=72036 RepID=A0A0K2UZR2_LEPSM
MSSVEELVDKLAKETLTSDFLLITKPSVTLVKLSHVEKLGPQVVASIQFETDMSFKMYHSVVLIDKKAVSHITSEGKVNTAIQAINLTSILGAKEELNQTETWEDILNKLVKFLNSSEIEPSQAFKLSFIREQKALLFTKPTARKYSKHKLGLSFSRDFVDFLIEWQKSKELKNLASQQKPS